MVCMLCDFLDTPLVCVVRSCHKPNGQSHGCSAKSFCSWDQALGLSTSVGYIHCGSSLVDNHCCVQDPDFETEGSVISCLQDFRDMLMESTCQDQVHKMMALAAEDIRFNQILSDACLSDRERFCKDTQQVTYRLCCSCQLVVLCIMLLCLCWSPDKQALLHSELD